MIFIPSSVIIQGQNKCRCDGIGRRAGLKIRWANTPCGFDPRHRHHKKSILRDAFFNEINPFRICEIPFGREIRLRRVKCLRALVDLFHFTLRLAAKFHNSSELFLIEHKRDISLFCNDNKESTESCSLAQYTQSIFLRKPLKPLTDKDFEGFYFAFVCR